MSNESWKLLEKQRRNLYASLLQSDPELTLEQAEAEVTPETLVNLAIRIMAKTRLHSGMLQAKYWADNPEDDNRFVPMIGLAPNDEVFLFQRTKSGNKWYGFGDSATQRADAVEVVEKAFQGGIALSALRELIEAANPNPKPESSCDCQR